jgi:hypothetical protein
VWHTMSDNLDNVDAATMGIVGQVLAQLIYTEQ